MKGYSAKKMGGRGALREELSIQAATWMNPNALCGLKEARLKGYILYNSIYLTFWKRQNYRE